jgi:hypothetical protein
MWLYHLFTSFFNYIERLNFNQFALMTLAIIAAGFLLLRGFGSRSNY